MMFSLRPKNIVRRTKDIAPDEIFLDAHNSPRFNRDQFEGRIERPIGRSAIWLFGIGTAAFLLLLTGRVFVLTVLDGVAYYEQSENNRLDNTILFAERGVIYDRNSVPLAWNELFETASTTTATTTAFEEDFARRVYMDESGLSHVLGFVSYPKKDSAGNYFQTDMEGIAGIEKEYDEILKGSAGRTIVEEDALGTVVSTSVIDQPEAGTPLYLSIDNRVQHELYERMKALAGDVGFHGGASAIIDVHTGQMLALVSFPEYDSNVMTEGEDNDLIATYQLDETKPFLNRAIGGLYTPGSIMKPFFAVGALEEKIIDPMKTIFSDGALRVPNPYDPEHPTIFKDWKAHGAVDMRQALAVSSNVYFMTIGGGFGDQEGLGIARLEEYARKFEIGELTGIDISGEVEGIIPSEKWKAKLFPDDPWRLGDTYNTSIGQYGFQATPLQMARAAAMIANDGLLITPHLRMDSETGPTDRIGVSPESLQIVREGMRRSVMEGIAKALNVSYVNIAGKTGTAELGATKANVNSWIMGFWPYENPQYAFATVMEQGPATNLVGSAFVMRGLFDWMNQNAPEYFE